MQSGLGLKRAMLCVAAMSAALAGSAASGQSGDGLIVPNERVGPVRLGMTSAEVVAVLGEPRSSGFFGQRLGYLSYCDGECSGPRMRMSIDTWEGRVYRITVQPEGANYATVQGARVGMSELNLRIRMGDPAQRAYKNSLNDGTFMLIYPGVMFFVKNGDGVTGIQICQPKYQQKKAHPKKGWCF